MTSMHEQSRRKMKIATTPNETDRFESAGNRLHGWQEHDYETNNAGEYTFTQVRQAFALWLAARGKL